MKNIKVHMQHILLKTFTFWGAEGFSVLVFSLRVKEGDRSFISGGSSWYNAEIEKEINVINAINVGGMTMMEGSRYKIKRETDI